MKYVLNPETTNQHLYSDANYKASIDLKEGYLGHITRIGFTQSGFIVHDASGKRRIFGDSELAGKILEWNDNTIKVLSSKLNYIKGELEEIKQVYKGYVDELKRENVRAVK